MNYSDGNYENQDHDQYSAVIEKYFFDKRFVGPLLCDDVKFVQVGTPKGGAVLWLWFKLNDRGMVEVVNFKAYGAPEVIAAGAWLCEWLPTSSMQQLQKLTVMDISHYLQLNKLQSRAALLIHAMAQKIIIIVENAVNKANEVNYE